MTRGLFAFGIAIAASTAAAQPAGTLMSSACRAALESLQAHETALLAAPRTDTQPATRAQRNPDAQLERLRRAAARACLGDNADGPPPPPSQQFAPPPIVVPSITGARRPPPSPMAPAAPLLKPAEPPTAVLGCDAIGCWANDGSRLMRVGPNLLGQRGLCTVQGAVLHCP